MVKLIVEHSLQLDLDEIPEGPPCPVCGFPTRKVFLDHLAYGTTVEVRTRNAPGYACPGCDVSMISPEAVILSLGSARETMLEYNDPISAQAFAEVIAARRSLIAQRDAAAPRTIIDLR